mmetsp:Transcript_45259/g.67228  ORF Transcript_45259/g.67228 Transcript_45259/m.67228 type:complete len:81 (-) Transcript_45259:176-418(-)
MLVFASCFYCFALNQLHGGLGLASITRKGRGRRRDDEEQEGTPAIPEHVLQLLTPTVFQGDSSERCVLLFSVAVDEPVAN